MNTHVKEAGFGKRLIAYLIDAISVIVLTVIFYSFVTSTYLFDSLGGNKARNEMNAFGVESGLFKPTYSEDGKSTLTSAGVYSFADTKDTSGAPSDQKQAGYAEYFDKVWNYYTVFYYSNSNMIKMSKTEYGVTTDYLADDYYSYFERSLLKLPDPSAITDVTKEANLYASVDGKTSSLYYKYALNDAGTAVDIHKKPVLQSWIQDAVDKNIADKLTALNTYMYSGTATDGSYGLYGDALVDLTGGNTSKTSIQTYYSSRYSQLNYDIWVCALVPFVPLQLIFFFIIPMCMKNGETLGKLAFSIQVVKIDGFRVTWKEKLIRQGLMTCLGMLVILPWTYIGIMAFVLIALIDYMVLVMSKTHQSLHDRLAKTEAISKKESLVFANEEDMAQYASTHLDQFPELQDKAREEENSQIATEDSILDLSTLNKNRDEARAMTSFDDYEAKKEAENAAKAASNPQTKVNLTKEEEASNESDEEQAMKDLAALEGGTPDENGEAKAEPADKPEEKEKK